MSNRATRRAAARQAMFAKQTPTGRPETSEAQLAANRANGRGRDASYPTPPAQIRTCRIPAYGSYLG